MKFLKFFILFLFCLIFSTYTVSAADNIVGDSGKLLAKVEFNVDERQKKLEKYLKSKNSPCAQYAKEFVSLADKYDLDWKLAPAISGIESSFCLAYPEYYNNPFGIAGGFYYFEDLPNAIEGLNKLLKETSYYKRWRETGEIYDLAVVYCESWPKWTQAVTKFMEEIEEYQIDSASTLTINL